MGPPRVPTSSVRTAETESLFPLFRYRQDIELSFYVGSHPSHPQNFGYMQA